MGGNCKQGLGQFSYTPLSKPPPMGENCKQGLLLIINIPFYSPLPFGGGAGGEVLLLRIHCLAGSDGNHLVDVVNGASG